MGFLVDLATHIKTWANDKFQTALPTPVGQSGKVVSSDGTSYVLTAAPTALSEFTNDLTAYYLKAETYTQTEINSMIGDVETLLAAL